MARTALDVYFSLDIYALDTPLFAPIFSSVLSSVGHKYTIKKSAVPFVIRYNKLVRLNLGKIFFVV